MNYACTLIAVVIGLGMAAVAAHESEARSEPSELQQAHHSRDFAAWLLSTSAALAFYMAWVHQPFI